MQRVVDGIGSDEFASRPTDAADVPVSLQIETIDPWAEAFAESSRLAARVAAREPTLDDPRYPVVLNMEVQFFLDRFTGIHREVVTLWVNRSARYLTMIRDIMRARGLPEELAFTAMIESGYNPLAVSRVGAKGMWQFMAATARRYGLRVDQWVDERLDPEKSTLAAAGYLRDLYNQFGSWSLAQAAYNAGEVKVARAIRATGTRDFWALARTKYLKRETKDFVPQIHAATMIGREPNAYGFDFDDHEPDGFDVVRVPAVTDLRRLASGTHIPLETLRGFNPTLVRGVTPPGTPYELRVPSGTRATVVAALEPRPSPRRIAVARAATKARAVAAASKKVAPVASSADVHVVRPKDTVSSIAKRYGISVGDVLRWNSLERNDRIRPGDRLRVADLRHVAERDGQGGFR
ncbi:MAG TPA: transglycosylase SLT domain-containing protein [Methylomirabilota bacterium]|nr:transglycosylase SLT domain-containing protein [Methylomirabilota bacterium]